MRREESAIDTLVSVVRHAWRHRPGFEAVGAILDVFDALGYETRDGQTPVLAHRHRTPYGWRLVFALPAGISSRDVEAKLHYFEEQAGASIVLQARGRLLHMDVHTSSLPTKVDYAFDPSQYADNRMPLPIGENGGGMLVVDLADVPHVLVAGNTGAGKSNILHVWMAALLSRGVALCVIDLKRLEFAYLRRHAVLANTETLACEVLRLLNRELDRRLETLEAAGVVNLKQYEGDDLPWAAVVIDELAELRDEDAQKDLNRLLRLSRAAGISVIAATQRPSHTLHRAFTDSRALFAGRLCFAMADRTDSEIVLGNDAAARLPQDLPGRAVWRWSRQVVVQTPYLPVARARKLLPQPKGGPWLEQTPARLLP